MAELEAEKQMGAVQRTVAILETLSRSGAVNLENLSRITGLPKATLLRFLSTLTSLGYVYRDEVDQYHLTLKMFSVGSRSLNHMDIVSIAKPFAVKLSEKLGETVHIAILEDDRAIYILKEESRYNIRMYSRVGKSIPLYCTAIGKIFLSAMDETALSAYFASHDLKPYTAKSIRSRQELEADLAKAKAQGWSFDDAEHEEHIKCIAAPIRNYSNLVVAVLSVSWPEFRFEEARKQEWGKTIKETADALSAILGYQKEKE